MHIIQRCVVYACYLFFVQNIIFIAPPIHTSSSIIIHMQLGWYRMEQPQLATIEQEQNLKKEKTKKLQPTNLKINYTHISIHLCYYYHCYANVSWMGIHKSRKCQILRFFHSYSNDECCFRLAEPNQQKNISLLVWDTFAHLNISVIVWTTMGNIIAREFYQTNIHNRYMSKYHQNVKPFNLVGVFVIFIWSWPMNVRTIVVSIIIIVNLVALSMVTEKPLEFSHQWRPMINLATEWASWFSIWVWECFGTVRVRVCIQFTMTHLRA